MNKVDALVAILQLTFATVGQRVACVVGVCSVVHAERRMSECLLHNHTNTQNGGITCQNIANYVHLFTMHISLELMHPVLPIMRAISPIYVAHFWYFKNAKVLIKFTLEKANIRPNLTKIGEQE